jgi:hypothetical protein
MPYIKSTRKSVRVNISLDSGLLEDIQQHGRRGNDPLNAGPATLKREGASEARELLSGKLLEEKPL